MPEAPSPRPPRPQFAPYRQALQAISQRTGTALPSLVVSFAILHELTAMLPLVGFFFGARALGVGERVVQAVASEDTEDGWMKQKGKEWVDEGGRWAQRVGRRYGVFGYEKRVPGEEESAGELAPKDLPARLAGDAANAILAYGLTKALLPARIGLSLYLAPAFSRRIVDPVRLNLLRPFRRKTGE